MAMELDDVLEILNDFIEMIERAIGTAEDRTDSIASWLLILDRGINVVKNDWHQSYRVSEGCEQKTVSNITSLIAAGVCCLEQFTNIYSNSCPWEHSFSYDDPLSIEESIIVMDDLISIAKHDLWHEPEEPYEKTLFRIKQMVITGVSCLLRNVTIGG